MHRLWYDLRTQALFEEQFRPDVLMIDATLQDMIGRVVTRYAELAGRDLAVTSRRRTRCSTASSRRPCSPT